MFDFMRRQTPRREQTPARTTTPSNDSGGGGGFFGGVVDAVRDLIGGNNEEERGASAQPNVCVDPQAMERALGTEGTSPEQRLEAAETARSGLDEQMGTLNALPSEERQQILEHVEGLEGDALVQEMRMLQHAMASPNADRALHAYAGIREIMEDDRDGDERLTPNVMEMLVNGVADSRTDSDRGQEGILGARQAREAAQALVDADGDDYDELLGLLNSAGRDEDGNLVEGADAGAEQALLLKAMATRGGQLHNSRWERIFGGDSDEAMSDLRAFAGDIRGEDRADLIRTTTLIDIDDVNTSDVNLRNFDANNDTNVDNDGLFQRYTMSCGPTTAQIVRGEADPMYARQVHNQGIHNAGVDTTSAEEQRDVLNDNGGGAESRLGVEARRDVTRMMDNMEVDENLSSDDRNYVNQLLNGVDLNEDQSAKAQDALSRVRAANDGRPTDAELSAIQANNGVSPGGMGLTPALNELTSPGTRMDYETNGVTDGDVANDVDDIEQRLLDGEDVPFRIGYNGGGGHFMSVTDVRRDDNGDRRFLMSDPWTGATRWVTEDSFTSGDFAKDTFSLGNATITHTYSED